MRNDVSVSVTTDLCRILMVWSSASRVGVCVYHNLQNPPLREDVDQGTHAA